jgi:prepilin-type N-terminal cleavage/methylation domain-containing protein
MRRFTSRAPCGFTLIELMIVVTILAILAALLIPALGRAQAQAQKTRCLGTAKSIATTTRTYATTWDGWTHPDPSYYIKLLGRPLYGDPTFPINDNNAINVAKAVKDFRCPADSSPALNFHNYFSSYAFLLPSTNLMAVESASLMVTEKGTRHPSKGTGALSFNTVYVDGSGGLAADRAGGASYDPATAQGALYYAWTSTNPGGVLPLLQTPTLDVAKLQGQATMVAVGTMASGAFGWDWTGWQWLADKWTKYPADIFNSNNNAAYKAVRNAVIRWDGYMTFKDMGNNTDGNVKASYYHIWIWAGNYGQWLWIDFNSNDKVDTEEVWTGDRWATMLIKDGKYKYVNLWYNNATHLTPHCRIYIRDATCNGCGGADFYYPFTNFWYDPGAAYVPGL